MSIKLTDDVLGSRRNVAEGRIILVYKFVIETITKNFAGALLNFADVDQHPGCWIDRTGEHEIGNVIASAAITRICFRSKRCCVLLFSPTCVVQASLRGKFHTLTDGTR